MKLKVNINSENNKISICFGSVKPNSVNMQKGVTANWNGIGNLTSIDIYPAKDILGIENLKQLELDQLVGVAEASAMIGVKKSNFIRDFASKEWFPEPVAELASGRIWHQADVEAAIKINKSKS